MSTPTPSAVCRTPYLERHPEQGGPIERTAVEKVPWTIGRAESADHVVYSAPVSKTHAAIVTIGERYAIRDLQSTNGTFVNGRRVNEQALEDGDIIHLAHVEFCFRHSQVTTAHPAAAGATQALPLGQPASLIRSRALLEELIATRSVTTLFQPIVDLESRCILGYEALSRGAHPQLTDRPDLLLSLAEQCGMAPALSRLFRRLAIARSRALPRRRKLFLNVHTSEIADPALFTALADASSGAPMPIVLEIPESSVTDVQTMATLIAECARVGLDVAYDDFGAGQARLVQLTDAPPAYLKLDKALVHGIDAEPRREMVGALLRVTSRLGVPVIAECIESRAVASAMHSLGCAFGQGYFFGRPVPADQVCSDAAR